MKLRRWGWGIVLCLVAFACSSSTDDAAGTGGNSGAAGGAGRSGSAGSAGRGGSAGDGGGRSTAGASGVLETGGAAGASELAGAGGEAGANCECTSGGNAGSGGNASSDGTGGLKSTGGASGSAGTAGSSGASTTGGTGGSGVAGTGGAGTHCVGTAKPCAELDADECARSLGCSFLHFTPCNGVPVSGGGCGLWSSDAATCNQHAQCTWDATFQCHSNPFYCQTATTESACMQSACTWDPTCLGVADCSSIVLQNASDCEARPGCSWQ